MTPPNRDQAPEPESEMKLPPLLARFSSALSCLCALLVFLGIAFRPAWLATYDLQWPYDFDLFRDAAFAQSIIHGHFPADAYYADEQNWYNPLGSALIAGIALLFGIEPIDIFAHYGAILGLAVPVAVFGLAVSLFGRWAGLASLFAFLFFGPHDLPSWAAPSYSPWLFANLLSLLPFALAMAVALRACASGTYRLWAVSGALLGVTFLAHTAAAIVAGSVMLVLAWERKKLRAVAIRWVLILVPAFVISTPFLMSILWHYGLQIQNGPPQDFISEETDLHQLPKLLWGTLNLRNAIALGGLVALFRNQAMKAARATLIAWLGICSVMLCYAFARQAWPNARLPGLVPPFHWLFHLRLARTLLLGYGLYCAVAAITVLLARSRKVPVPIALLLTLGVFLLFQFRPFVHRFDFEQTRQHSLSFAATPGFNETIAWLRRGTPSGAIILAPAHEALIMLGAAGRQTVVIYQIFSNPYVDYEPRAVAADDMARNLGDHQRDPFLQLAAKYGVSYVLINDGEPAFFERCLTAPFMTLVFSSGHFAVLRVER